MHEEFYSCSTQRSAYTKKPIFPSNSCHDTYLCIQAANPLSTFKVKSSQVNICFLKQEVENHSKMFTMLWLKHQTFPCMCKKTDSQSPVDWEIQVVGMLKIGCWFPCPSFENSSKKWVLLSAVSKEKFSWHKKLLNWFTMCTALQSSSDISFKEFLTSSVAGKGQTTDGLSPLPN